MSEKKDVFISYSSAEYDEALIVKGILEKNGIGCWMAPESIPLGSNYTKEIPMAISNCHVFLLLLSESAQRSKWVPLELDRAYNEGKVIIPFVIKDCALTDDFNFMLAKTERIEAYHKKETAFERLVGVIHGVLKGAKASGTQKESQIARTIGIVSVIAVLLIAAVTVILITLGNQNHQQRERHAEESTAAQTDEPTKAVIGSVGDYVRSRYQDATDSGVTFRIPEITIDSDDAREVNDEIDEMFNSIQYGVYGAAYSFLDYDAYLNNDILSVVVTAENGDTSIFEYYVYNFDLTNGRRLTNRTLCKKIGTTWSELQQKVASKMKYSYINYYPSQENTAPMLMTLSDVNVGTSQLFIGNTRKVQAVCTFYVAAGSGVYQRILDITTYKY